jgi:TonB family protein
MNSFVIAFAAAALTMLNGTAAAQSRSVEDWVAEVNRKLDRKMVYPANGEAGKAVVTFELGEDGRARAVSVHSGNRALTRAARQTLIRVGTLPALPSGYAGTRIRMQVIVGDPNRADHFLVERERMLAAASASNARLAGTRAATQLAAAGIR